MRRLIPALLIVCASALPRPVVASQGTGAVPYENIPVPGGVSSLARALGMTPPGRAVFISELVRHLHRIPEGQNAESDTMLQALTQHLQAVGEFTKALAAVQPKTGGISLSLAAQKNERNRLKSFLDLLGLKLRETKGRYSVEPTKDKDAAERVRLLSNLGLELGPLASRLTAGASVRLDIPVEQVPVALDVATWSRVILQRPVAADALFSVIVSDRRASLLAAGLAWMDDATLLFFAQNPALLRRLYEDHAAVFSGLGRGIRVTGSRVITPGGEAAIPLWEELVDAKVGQPERFIRNLLDRQDGRTAYLYDTIASLDEPHARFALGLWMSDPEVRRERFTALARVAASAFREFTPNTRPFWRPASDLGIMLARIDVGPDGVPSQPNWRRLWERAFDGVDLPDEPARQLRDIQRDGTIDAAWLGELTMVPDSLGRKKRLDQVSFGQRVFRAASESALPDVLVALRGLPRFTTLMLTLDRMDIIDPALYAAAAQRGLALWALDRHRAFTTLAQFQSALALVAQLRIVRVFSVEQAANATRALVALDLSDGRYRGAIARWFDEVLIPALPQPGDSVDTTSDGRLVAALGGVGSPVDRETRIVAWEDRTYRLDLAGAEHRRIGAVRAKLGGYKLEQVLTLARDVRQLAALDARSMPADVQRIAQAIKTDSAMFTVDKTPRRPGVEAPSDPRKVIAQEVKDLSRIQKPKDVKKAADSVEPLTDIGDGLLAHVLLSYAYALALGDPDGTALLSGDVARRHDFGFDLHVEEARLREPWRIAVEQRDPGVPWHARGSLLALDVGLSSLALRRVASDKPAERPHLLNANDRQTFSDSVAMLNPFAAKDSDRDEIASALTRGRARVAAWTSRPQDIETAMAEVPSLLVDGRRQRAIRWALAHDPESVARWLPLSEVLALGKPNGTTNQHPWGMSALPFEGCLCTRLQSNPPWQLLENQNSVGVLAARIADVNLRVIEVTADLKLPAALVRGILAAAVQDYLDEVQPSDPDDWMTFVFTAQRMSRERIEDYMGALTANGTLAPVKRPGERQAPR